MTEKEFDTLDLASIDAFIADKQEEHLHLDFKTIAEAGLRRRDDRRNLAEAISGFANSDGGVIVWGVDARLDTQGVDCAIGKAAIQPLSLFISKLTQFSGEAVTPAVDGVKHRRIEIDDDRGFAATLIPVSDSGPHMAKLGVDRYIKRSGSQFLRMEHFEVEDMFGRRRRPHLSLTYRVVPTVRIGNGDLHYTVVLSIENSGRGPAKAPFVSLRIEPPYRISEYGLGNRTEGLPRLVTGEGIDGVRFGSTATVVVHPGTVHDIIGVEGKLLSSQDLLEDFVVHYSVTAEDIRLRSDLLRIPGTELVQKLRAM